MGKPGQDSLGDRMKRFEQASQIYLTRRMPVIIRIDGKAHHTFTRGLNKPFDEIYMRCMQDTMKFLCENIQGCVLGYTQSDEITLVLIDYQTLTTDAWFDYRLDKMCSVAASMATLQFNKSWKKFATSGTLIDMFDNESLSDDDKKYVKTIEQKCDTAMFDARSFNVPKEDVTNCVLWRQQDAERNSIQGLAQSMFSHKELNNLSCSALQDKMVNEKGINWNDLPSFKKRGSACIRDTEYRFEDELPWEKSKWLVDLEMPILKGDENRKYIENLINVGD